jgi:hypothetical protein
MKELRVALKNCHGIRKLETTHDFSKGRPVAIYALNWTMKTSFARTFIEFAARDPRRPRVSRSPLGVLNHR